MKPTTQAGSGRKSAQAASTKVAKPLVTKGGKNTKASKFKAARTDTVIKRTSRRFFIKAAGGLIAYKLQKDPKTGNLVLVLAPEKKPVVLSVRRMGAIQMLREGDELEDGDVITLDDANPTAVEIVLDDSGTGDTCATVTPTADPQTNTLDYEVEVDLSEIECFEEYYDEEASADETTWYFGDDDTTIGIEG